MRLRPSLLLMVPLLAGPLAAQEFAVRDPGGTRAFAQPGYWLTTTPDNRLPIRERLLTPQAGLTALAPPSPRRSGLTPWISTALEGNNSGARGDSVLTIAPGLSYRYQDRRLRFSADYAVEAALHDRPGLTRAVQGHGGFATLSYDLTPRSQLSLFNLFSDSRDTRDVPVQGALAGATRLITNAFAASYRTRLSQRSGLDLTYRNTGQWIDAATLPDIRENAVSVKYDHALSEVMALSTTASTAWFDFGRVNRATRSGLDATLTRDFGARLAASGTLGLLHTSDGGGHTTLRYGAELTHTDRFARYTLAAARDVIAVPGLANLAQSDEVSAQALLRLDDGLILTMSLGHQRLRSFDAARTRVDVTSATGTLSYAVDRQLWLWAQLDLNREKSGGATRRNNRFVIGLSRSFDP